MSSNIGQVYFKITQYSNLLFHKHPKNIQQDDSLKLEHKYRKITLKTTSKNPLSN